MPGGGGNLPIKPNIIELLGQVKQVEEKLQDMLDLIEDDDKENCEEGEG